MLKTSVKEERVIDGFKDCRSQQSHEADIFHRLLQRAVKHSMRSRYTEITSQPPGSLWRSFCSGFFWVWLWWYATSYILYIYNSSNLTAQLDDSFQDQDAKPTNQRKWKRKDRHNNSVFSLLLKITATGLCFYIKFPLMHIGALQLLALL